jgi:hypothetical protein
MELKQLPMFGITLISQTVNREPGYLDITMRQAGSDLIWFIGVPEGHPAAERLTRPGACFALVELASASPNPWEGRLGM